GARRLRVPPVAAALVFVLGVAVPVVEMVRLHPYEYTAFNWFSGGVAGARDRYMLDYWGLSFKQASQALLARLAERHQTKAPGPPAAAGGSPSAARTARRRWS